MNSSDSNKSTNVLKCPTRLLSDLPADDDAFGSHKRVAQAIVNLIKEEEGGKTIALIGAWGSGKSTVVNFLKNELQDFRDTAVFVFDAWAHEGDPLRRSFLERLVGFLGQDGNGWLKDKKKSDKERWDKKLKQLSNAFEETEIKSTPYLTWPGRFMIPSTLLLPVGYILLNVFLSNNNSNSPITWLPKWLPVWLLGVILIISPLIIVFMTYLYWRPTWRFWRQEFWNKHRSPHKNDSVFYLFAKNVREIVESKTVRTPDPTSIEFQKFFRETIVEALRDEGRSLVITIDNLDRLNTKEAISIWATMRTFFEFDESSRRPAWVKRLWLLVPFSPQAPQRLWKKLTAYEEKKEGENNGQGTSKEPVEEKSLAQKSLAEEFVDKTFQVVFQVPLPVMSDWKDFFKKELIEALPKHDKDSYAIYRIFEKKRSDSYRPPTPREIKLFINKLGAYHRIWHDEIPLSIQAWYVLEVSEKLKAQAPEAVLLDKELLSDDLKGVIKEAEWQKYLAALYFNVVLEKAMQVLIGDEIKDYLRSGKGEKIKELQEQVEHQSFIAVLEHVIADNSLDWRREEPSSLAKAAVALKNFRKEDSPEWQRIWANLHESATQAMWTDLDKEAGEGLVIILEDCPKEQYEREAQAILEHFLEPEVGSKDEETPQIPDPATIEVWSEGLVCVLRAIHETGHGDLIREHFKMPGNAEFYVEVIRELAQMEMEEDLIEYFAPPTDANQVVTRLATLCEQGQFHDPYAYGLQIMLKLDGSWSWDGLVQAIQKRLDTSEVLKPSEVKGCLRALLSLEKERISQAQSGLQSLSEQGCLMHHLHHANANNVHEAVALCLTPILEFTPSGDVTDQPGDAPEGQELYERILNNPPRDIIDALTDIVCTFQKADMLLENAEEPSDIWKIISAVIEALIKRKNVYKHLSSSSVIKHHDLLQGMLHQDSSQNLIDQLVEKGDLLQEIVEKWEFSGDFANLYLQTLKASQGREDREAFIGFLVEGLHSFSKEKWLETINQENSTMNLVASLVEQKVPVGLSGNYRGALFDHAKKILEGEIPHPEDGDLWERYLGALEEGQKLTFLRDLRDELITQSDKSGEAILSVYGNALLWSKVLEEKYDEVVRRWFIRMLERRNPEELDWLEKALTGKSKLFGKSHSGTQDAFRDDCQRAWGETEEEQIKQHLESIAKAIGLEFKQELPELEEEEVASESEEE